MIVLATYELLTSGLRELLEEEWEVITSHPGDENWLKWDGVELFVVQYELVPNPSQLVRIAPAVVIGCNDNSVLRDYLREEGVSEFFHVSATGEEVLKGVDRALEGTPLPPQAVRPLLSPRQTQVLNLVAQGLTYEEIAERLDGVNSPAYISNVALTLYKKLGVEGKGPNNRVRALRRAREMGLVS